MANEHSEEMAIVLFADLVGSAEISNQLGIAGYRDVVHELQRVLIRAYDDLFEKLPEPQKAQVIVPDKRGDEVLVILRAGEPKPNVNTELIESKLVYWSEFAIQVAIGMRMRWLASDWNSNRLRDTKSHTDIAIGIHAGPVSVHTSKVGAKAEGATINYAKRVETASRSGRRSRIVVSHTVHHWLERGSLRLSFARMDEVQMKGFPSSAPTYELVTYGVGAREPFVNEDAIPVLEQLTVAYPDDTFVLTALGDHFYKSQRWHKAARGFRQLTMIAPDLPDAWHRLGQSYYYLLQFKDAAWAYNRALEKRPHSPHVLRNMAISYRVTAWYSDRDSIADAFALAIETAERSFQVAIHMLRSGEYRDRIAEREVLDTRRTWARTLGEMVFRTVEICHGDSENLSKLLPSAELAVRIARQATIETERLQATGVDSDVHPWECKATEAIAQLSVMAVCDSERRREMRLRALSLIKESIRRGRSEKNRNWRAMHGVGTNQWVRGLVHWLDWKQTGRKRSVLAAVISFRMAIGDRYDAYWVRDICDRARSMKQGQVEAELGRLLERLDDPRSFWARHSAEEIATRDIPDSPRLGRGPDYSMHG